MRYVIPIMIFLFFIIGYDIINMNIHKIINVIFNRILIFF